MQQGQESTERSKWGFFGLIHLHAIPGSRIIVRSTDQTLRTIPAEPTVILGFERSLAQEGKPLIEAPKEPPMPTPNRTEPGLIRAEELGGQ